MRNTTKQASFCFLISEAKVSSRLSWFPPLARGPAWETLVLSVWGGARHLYDVRAPQVIQIVARPKNHCLNP